MRIHARSSQKILDTWEYIIQSSQEAPYCIKIHAKLPKLQKRVGKKKVDASLENAFRESYYCC